MTPMTLAHLLAIVAVLASSTVTAAPRAEKPPSEVQAFVPRGYEVLDFALGDLDGDARADAILVLKKSDEASIDEETPRPFLLLVRQPDGRLKQARRADRVVHCYHCGGTIGDPYQGTDIKQGAFTIRHAGGGGEEVAGARGGGLGGVYGEPGGEGEGGAAG